MAWAVEVTAEFERWWATLTSAEQVSVDAHILLLQARGPALGRPHVDHVARSRHANMKELRVQHRGRPLRILFAFDPRRVALLLLGGDKTGDGRWYRVQVPRADDLFDRHLAMITPTTPGRRR